MESKTRNSLIVHLVLTFGLSSIFYGVGETVNVASGDLTVNVASGDLTPGRVAFPRAIVRV